MADITNLFKATVKTVKTRLKAQGQSVGPDKSILGQGGHINQKGEFAQKLAEVVSNITQLKDFLVEHRKQYINAFSQLGRETSKMTDAERDQIDTDAETYMRLCSDAIKTLKAHEATAKHSPQVKEHRGAVLLLVENYLKGVCKSYSEQRAIRVKRVVDRKRISRLEPENKKMKFPESTSSEENKEGNEKENSEEKVKAQEYVSQLLQNTKQEEEDELSPEEMQMFEQENQQLYEDMNSMVDEVKQIEGKVVEISRLQEIFAEKVLDQEKDIDRIANTVVGTSENIREANEDIREAMKNNAGLRVWILFFLIVCSFSLLFLDWYNP